MTSGGSDNGAPPTRDLHLDVLEKGCVEDGVESARSKRAGDVFDMGRRAAHMQRGFIVMVDACRNERDSLMSRGQDNNAKQPEFWPVPGDHQPKLWRP